MVMRFLQGLLWLCLLLNQGVWAASFSAQVDRQNISEDDSFTLVLRYEGQALRSEPDTSPLSQNFNILAQQRSQQLSYTNGQKESYTSWILTLSPKSTGTLTIPAIKFSNEQSQPITITVTPISAEALKQAEQDFFFETNVQPETGLVVQGQLLYTEKLYYRYQHNNASLSEFKVTDAKVLQLGDVRQYSTEINGTKFGVYERQFAIFPEVSGELVIPGSRFNANISDRYSWQGRPVKAVGKPLHFDVGSIPRNYPSNASWLPSNKLIIEEQFSTPLNQWQEGEAVTRTITLKAQGVLGSQLPSIQLPVVSGVRYYPDQAKTSDNINNLGIQGISEQAIAMVVTQKGELILPEVRIPWWNMQTRQIEYAVLPAHTITVKGTRNTPAPQETIAPSITLPIESSNSALPVTPVITNSTPNYLIWLLGAVLALSMLLNIILLSRSKKNSQQIPAKSNTQPETNAYWRAFKQACKQQQTAVVRQQLLAWVNAGGLAHIDLTRPISSLSNLAQNLNDSELALALNELDAALFASDGKHSFDAGKLLKLVEQEERNAKLAQKSASLYAS